MTAEPAERRVVVTFTGGRAAHLRRLSLKMRVSMPEIARRGLSALDFILSLDDDEELMIRNKKTGDVDRIVMTWLPTEGA